MKPWIATGCLLALLPLAAAAQQVPVKTVPVATGNQFMIFPSQNMSMGGVSIALDDPLYDPFVNPAKGINLQGVRFTGTPMFYNVSLDDGGNDGTSSGRTLPVGMLLRQGTFFGGAMMAWQELSQPRLDFCCIFVDVANRDASISAQVSETRPLSTNNVYAFGMAGAQLPGTNLSAGVSVFLAGLKGIEGVRLLYVDGDRVNQSGHLSSVSAGLYQRWDDGRAAELVVQHHRFDVQHDLPRWTGEGFTTQTEEDQTRGWAVQAGFQQPLQDGWRLGARLVGDWKHHPKIPNYDLMRIPRDPGNSSAYNVGLGLARTVRQTTYGIDLVYEPIWSHTWAAAAADIPAPCPSCNSVPAGEMTVENFFRFDNSILRLGVQQAGERVDFGLGVNLHTYRYDLDQEDFILQSKRSQHESWSEWTLSLGLGLNFTEFQVRYLGLLTLGTGRPGIQDTWGGIRRDADAASFSDVLLAPAGALTLQDAHVVTHQITLLIPISE